MFRNIKTRSESFGSCHSNRFLWEEVRELLPESIEGEGDEQTREDLDRMREDVEQYDKHEELSIKNFDRLINQNNKIVILDVGGTWCSACHTYAPILNEFNSIFHDQISIVSVTQDQNPELDDLAKKIPQVKAESLPYFVFYKEGKQFHEYNKGRVPIETLLEVLEAAGLKVAPRQRAKATFLAAKSFPEQVLENIKTYDPDIRPQLVQIAAEKAPLAFLKHYLSLLQPLDPDKSILRKAAFDSLDWEVTGWSTDTESLTLDHLEAFASENFAPDILKLIIQKNENPLAVLYGFKKYADQPYAFTILGIAASYVPGNFVAYFHEIKKQAPASMHASLDKMFEDYVDGLMRTAPREFILNFKSIREHRFTNGIPDYGIRLLDRMIENDPVNGLLPNRYDDLPDAKQRLAGAIERAIVSNPAAIFKNFYIIFNQVKLISPAEERQIIVALASKAPRETLNSVQEYKNKPYKEEVLLTAIRAADQRDPRALFENVGGYGGYLEHVPENKLDEVLAMFKRHYLNFPELVMQQAFVLIGLPDGETMVSTVMDANPKIAMKKWSYCLEEKSSLVEKLKDIVSRSLEDDPITIIEAEFDLPSNDFFKAAVQQAEEKVEKSTK